MTEPMKDTSTVVPLWSGFHHIVLVTRDLDATMRFYSDLVINNQQNIKEIAVEPGSTAILVVTKETTRKANFNYRSSLQIFLGFLYP